MSRAVSCSRLMSGDPPHTELYTPTSRSLEQALGARSSQSPLNQPGQRDGPQVVMPGGNTLVVGRRSAAGAPDKHAPSPHRAEATALYHYKAGTIGTWSAGPNDSHVRW